MKGLARPGFVGRADELMLLDEGLAAATGSRPGCVAVTGDAGVGKTRLLAEFAARARAEGARVVVGAGLDVAADELPFGVFLSALRDLARADAATRSYDEVLALLRAPPPSGRGADLAGRAQLFERVLDLLGELGDETPIVLILEDLHWADRTSLDLLQFLVQDLCQERDLLRDLPRERILLVLSWRSDEVVDGSPRWDALADLGRLSCVDHVRLGPLAERELATLLEAAADGPVAAARVEEIARRSAGNPLFAQELLAAGGSSRRAAAASCREVVLRRSRRMSTRARQVVRALAVAGRPVDDSLLATVVRMPAADLAAGLREALDHRLVRRDDDGVHYAFRHPLGQEAVYDDILPGERLDLHRRTAEALSDQVGDTATGFTTAELAHHWYEAQVWEQALPAALQAARAAARVTGFAEAHLHFRRALEAWPHVPAAADLLGCDLSVLQEEAAEAAHWAGAAAEAVELASAGRDAARAGGDPLREARLSERLGRYLWELGDTGASLAADRDAVRLLAGSPPSRLQARARAALAAGLMLDGESAAAAEEALAAIELARAAGVPEEEGYALTTLGVCRAVTGELAEGLRLLEQARSLCEECGSLEEVVRVYTDLTFVLTTAGRPQQSLEVAYAGMTRTRQLGLTSTGGGALLVNTASTLQVLGDWDEAVRTARDALQQGVAAAFGGYLHLVLGDVATARGDGAAAEESYAAAERIDPLRQDAWFAATLAASRAEQQLWAGAPDTALRTVTATLPALGKPDYDELAVRLCALGERALADLATRGRLLPDGGPPDRAAAEAFAAREQQCRDGQARAATPAIDVHLAQAEAERGRGVGAPDPRLWATVADGWEALGQPYPAAQARWREAEALAAAKARRRAHAALTDAMTVAATLRAAPLTRQLAALAARTALPVDPLPAQRTGGSATVTTAQRLGLTRREQQVLPLVASGRTNRQIARALFISEKTVSVHVSNIMAKLGAANRGEAAAAAFTLDLVPTPPVPASPG